VYGVLEGYIANLQNQFAHIVWRSSLTREDKLILFALDSVKGWLKYEKDTITIYDDKKPREVKLEERHEWKIFKHLLGKNRRPRLKLICMHLNSKVAKLQARKANGAKSFDYWLKVSTLDKRKPVFIPLKRNSYAESLYGKFKDFYQIVGGEEKISVKVVEELNKKPYILETDAIAVSLGLRALFALNGGELVGSSF
jgi:putative transposase